MRDGTLRINLRQIILEYLVEDVTRLIQCGAAIIYGAFYFLLSIVTMLICGCVNLWVLLAMSLPLVIMAGCVVPIFLRFRYIGLRLEDVFYLFKLLYKIDGDLIMYPILFMAAACGGIYYLFWLGVANTCGCLNILLAIAVALPLLPVVGYLMYVSFML